MTSSSSSHQLKEISEFYSNDNTQQPVSKIKTTGDGDEFIHIGNQKFNRHELMRAFGGTLNPGLSPPPSHEMANPAAFGLCAFALTTFTLSLYNAQAMGVKVPAVVLGLTCFYGGAVQFLSGVWELVVGNCFAGTALVSYGSFWLSYSCITIKAFGVSAAYEDPTMLANAIGFFLMGWAIFTFLLVLVTLKSTVAFFCLFFFLDLTFILLAAGEFSGNVGVTRAGGVIGIIAAFWGFYNAYAGVANRSNSYFIPHVIPLTRD